MAKMILRVLLSAAEDGKGNEYAADFGSNFVSMTPSVMGAILRQVADEIDPRYDTLPNALTQAGVSVEPCAHHVSVPFLKREAPHPTEGGEVVCPGYGTGL